jgi:signal transduction histidine kinase
MGGFLDRVFVGPDTVLSAAYDLRYLLLKTLPQQLVAWQAALALAVLVVWIGRRGERMYLTLSIILGLGMLRDFALFISGEESANVLLRATNLTSLWQASLLPGLVAPLFGRPSPVPLRWTLAPPAAITALFVLSLVLAVLPPIRFGELWTVVALPWTIVMQGVAIWIVVEAAFCRRFVAARVLLGVLLLAAMLAGHDLLVFFGFLADQRVLLTRFSSPLVMTAISALLMWRFAMALNEVSGFNQVLRQEVSAAEAALHASFAREQARLRDAALESERLRLTRDLHDGLAGQLVSIVAQCELRGAGFGTVSTAARRALDDLRLVVASLADVGNDLALMLAKFREHIEPQLLAQGMELDWQMTPLPEIEELRSEHTLALFRILQEAVSNAVRHSGCRTVTIAMAAASRDYAVRIVVSDRGRGSAAIRAGGHGLVNMRRRAEALGAALTIKSGTDGTCIMIDLPHALPALGAGGSGD